MRWVNGRCGFSRLRWAVSAIGLAVFASGWERGLAILSPPPARPEPVEGRSPMVRQAHHERRGSVSGGAPSPPAPPPEGGGRRYAGRDWSGGRDPECCVRSVAAVMASAWERGVWPANSTVPISVAGEPRPSARSHRCRSGHIPIQRQPEPPARRPQSSRS